MTTSSDWRMQANCRGLDPKMFVPPVGEDTLQQEAYAKTICSGCCVRAACANFSTKYGLGDGVWGGLSFRDRRRMRWHRQKLEQRNRRMT
jgi:WhiB family redox-sensing transcriptional regulator